MPKIPTKVESSSEEIVTLRREIERLQKEIRELKANPPLVRKSSSTDFGDSYDPGDPSGTY